MGILPKTPSVLTIGETTHVPGWVEIEFSDDMSTHDFDIVIWDPNSFRTPSFARLGEEVHASQLIPALERRAKEFETFLQLGGVIIVFASPEHRAPLTTKAYFEDSDITGGWAAFPYQTPALTAAHGKQIQVNGDTPLAAFLREHQHRVAYTAVIEVPDSGSVLATAGKTSKAVSVMLEFPNGGRLVLMPEMDRNFLKGQGEGYDQPAEIDVASSRAFYTSLVRAAQTVLGELAPDWVADVSTLAEQNLSSRHKAAAAVLKTAQMEMSGLDFERAAMDADKMLLYGSGDSLAERCSSIFERLGAKRLPAPVNRADLRFEYNDKILVMEVKGLSKSAKEENAAQLEKWVMEEITSGTEFEKVKALLIANAFRHKPLEERAASFPPQMIPMSVQRQHALVTTTQLFVLASQVADGTVTAEAAMALLISTVGVLQGFDAAQLTLPGQGKDKV